MESKKTGRSTKTLERGYYKLVKMAKDFAEQKELFHRHTEEIYGTSFLEAAKDNNVISEVLLEGRGDLTFDVFDTLMQPDEENMLADYMEE